MTIDKSALPVFLSTAAVGTLTLLLWERHRRRNCIKKLHVSYEHPNMPIAIKIMAALPEFIRLPLLIKGAAPKPPTDGLDIQALEKGNVKMGEYSPYEISEIASDCVWRVQYSTLFDPAGLDAFKSIFGFDFVDPTLVDRVPTDMKTRVSADVKIMSDLVQEAKKIKKEEMQQKMFREGRFSSQDTLITRLKDTKGLLIYNPCRMHPEIIEWLRSLGEVEWIVSGSSSHTNMLTQAAEAFPNAKIMCAKAAEAKCIAVGMRNADIIYTEPNACDEVNKVLERGGVSVFYVKGDVVTRALCVLAHGHLFTVDLMYGRSDGKQTIWVDEEDWKNGDSMSHTFSRLFFYAGIHRSVSATGLLPDYRLMGMDPSSTFSKIFLEQPKKDGSSCTEMAKSLRGMLKLDFDAVHDAHCETANSTTPDEFRKTIDASWNWLDGCSLLP